MKLVRSVKQMAALTAGYQQQRRRVGVVPTMGALHEGHLSLIRVAREQNDIVIVTIFVNPLQFGPQEDFKRYPRSLTKDRRLAAATGADLVFAPSITEIYPAGFQTGIDVGELVARWEGASRLGHFRGVATVVAILFQLTQPTNAYVGQKDYQQSVVIRRMAADLRFRCRIHVLPTVREADGLAMSSRNASLRPAERRQATVLVQALELARTRIQAGAGDAGPLIDEMRQLISAATSARIDYVAIVHARTLEPQWRLHGALAILVAVWIGRTRLIDNILVDVP